MGELDDFMFQLITGYSRFLVCGDNNFHIENPEDLFAKRFMALSSDFRLTDHITGRPTHRMYYCIIKKFLVSTPKTTIYKFHCPIFSVLGMPSSQNSSKLEKAPLVTTRGLLRAGSVRPARLVPVPAGTEFRDYIP